MKNTITYTSFFVVSFLFFGLAFARQMRPKAVDNDLISDICSKTLHPTECEKMLRSEPSAVKATNPTELGHISIRLATKKARENSMLISTLVKDNKAILDTCIYSYDDTIYYLKEAETNMKQNMYIDMGTDVMGTFDYVETCADTFKEMSVTEPPLYKKGEEDLNNLLDIVIRVAARLCGKY